MDLSFIGDQLGNFADFASGIKNLFQASLASSIPSLALSRRVTPTSLLLRPSSSTGCPPPSKPYVP